MILWEQYYNLMFFVLGMIILMIFFFTPAPFTFWMSWTFFVGSQLIFLVSYLTLKYSMVGAQKMIV